MEFNIGDRVITSTVDKFNGFTGTVIKQELPNVVSQGVWEFQVELDNPPDSLPHGPWFHRHELKPLESHDCFASVEEAHCTVCGAEATVRPKSPRADALDEAKELITGDRNNSYGPPTQDFKRTADALSGLGYRKLDPAGKAVPLESHDTAIMVAVVKMSRLMWTPGKRDSWVDGAGYFACGYECAVEEGHTK